MNTIKCYTCECGEDFYEDDDECVNCGALVDQSKFAEEELIKIVSQGVIVEEWIPLKKTD